MLFLTILLPRADIKNGCVSMIAKTTIPVSYAVFGGITLASSVIFATLMFLHLVYSFSLINIWYTAMLFLGSAGLFLVDLFAIRDWMKLAGVYIRKQKADKCDIFFARVFQNIVKTLMKEITSVPGRINLGMSILLTFIIFIYILKTALESTSAAIARIFAKIEGPDDNSNIFVMFLIYTGFWFYV